MRLVVDGFVFLRFAFVDWELVLEPVVDEAELVVGEEVG